MMTSVWPERTTISVGTTVTMAPTVIYVYCPRCPRKLAKTTEPLQKVITLTCPRCRESVTVWV